MAWDTTAFTAGSIPTAANFASRITGDFQEIGDARTAYTPALTGWTLGNGTLTGTYIEAGKLIIGTLSFTVGSTTTITGTPSFSLPVTSISSTGPPIGTGSLNDVSVPTRAHRFVFLTSTTTFQFTAQDDTRLSPTSPWTWATGDLMWAQFMYEAA